MKILFFASMIIILLACDNNIPPGSFKLEGFVEGEKDFEKIMLHYYTLKNEEWYQTADTAEIINGKFVFTGFIDELTAASLCFEKPDNVVIEANIYLEPTLMKLQINKNKPYNYRLSGTKVEKENLELRKVLETYNKIHHDYLLRLDDLLTQIQQNDNNHLILDSLYKEFNRNRGELRTVDSDKSEILLDFILKHKTYQIIPDQLLGLPIDTAKSIFNSLPEQSKTGLMGNLTYKKLEYRESWQKSMQKSQENSAVGCSAPDFTREVASGKIFRLSEYKNKNFVLLHFWASWCGPCIRNIPKITNLYEKYGRKGLVFLGISADKDSTMWLNAIEKHKLNQWPQILSDQPDKKFVFDSEEIGFLYNVIKIPCYILIDKQGKIAARWVVSINEEQLLKLMNYQ